MQVKGEFLERQIAAISEEQLLTHKVNARVCV
jgi:hypothetical protein